MVVWGVMGFVVLVVGYTLVMFLLGLRRTAGKAAFAERRQFVVFIPCLNEELVIVRTLDRLISGGATNLTVVVIDDASDDRTAELVEAYPHPRVGVLRRTLPDARQGKGQALNAAYRALRDHVRVHHIDPTAVVVGVLDADGRRVRVDTDPLNRVVVTTVEP